jgi:hypothetical protein
LRATQWPYQKQVKPAHPSDISAHAKSWDRLKMNETIAVNINRAGLTPRTRQGYRVEKIEQSEDDKETKKSNDGAVPRPD